MTNIKTHLIETQKLLIETYINNNNSHETHKVCIKELLQSCNMANEKSFFPLNMGKMLGYTDMIHACEKNEKLSYLCGDIISAIFQNLYQKDIVLSKATNIPCTFFENNEICKKETYVFGLIKGRFSIYKSEHNLGGMTDEDVPMYYDISSLNTIQQLYFGKIMGILEIMAVYQKYDSNTIENIYKNKIGYICGILQSI